jgi:hypothetical protein
VVCVGEEEKIAAEASTLYPEAPRKRSRLSTEYGNGAMKETDDAYHLFFWR